MNVIVYTHQTDARATGPNSDFLVCVQNSHNNTVKNHHPSNRLLLGLKDCHTLPDPSKLVYMSPGVSLQLLHVMQTTKVGLEGTWLETLPLDYIPLPHHMKYHYSYIMNVTTNHKVYKEMVT